MERAGRTTGHGESGEDHGSRRERGGPRVMLSMYRYMYIHVLWTVRGINAHAFILLVFVYLSHLNNTHLGICYSKTENQQIIHMYMYMYVYTS